MDGNQNSTDLKAAVEQARSLAREQVAAAWQLHIERVREELESGWRERLDQIFEERFNDVESQLREGFELALQSSVQTGVENESARCRKEVTDGLNETARRLRGAESREEWIRILIEAASPSCGRAAVFALTPKGLILADQPPIPLAAAPAFASAVESKDTVVAVGTARELSEAVSSLLGDASTKKVYLFPVVVRQTVVAVLYAEAGEQAVDVTALELLAFLAAASIDATESVVVKTPASSDLIRIAGAGTASSGAPVGPVWAELPRPEQELHLRAQRFARTRVAEMLLHKVRQVHAGRDSNNLYGMLKEEIEAGREAFRGEFIENCPSMVDYFHLELQRTLAKDNAVALGPDYPGPLPVGAVAR